MGDLNDSQRRHTSLRPFYIDDLSALREKLERAERDGAQMGNVWRSVRHRALVAPDRFPWFVPFTALMTGRAEDLEAGRQAIRNYVATLDAQQFGMGVQFHFWCFAFPHARWTLYFQWLESLGAWSEEEACSIREKLLTFQFINFFYGMRSKPEPECVDNQTMSLCFSNALCGALYGGQPVGSALANRMFRDGFRRLPSMLGGMPPSGYSGEGSTYMDYVVGPCVPFVVELLERVEGGDWFSKDLPPMQGSAKSILRMIAREWMPNGLLLPWDHYGYAQPVRSAIAYAARRTGDPLYFELLEQHANWAHEVSIGWGFDDLVWSLIWWPENRPASHGNVFPSWAEPAVGAALVSSDTNLYLMQMWDHTAVGVPGREHFNPNALVMAAYGSPLTTDGVTSKGCHEFEYEDTWLDLTNMNFGSVRSNFGSGCAGSHSVLIVDGRESMRAFRAYPQARMIEFDPEMKSIETEVTPLYQEHIPDTITVRRRSKLCDDRFWLIEDLAEFGSSHTVTARWYLRPQIVSGEAGVSIETAEGVRLHLIPLHGPDTPVVKSVTGYPDRLDGESVRADFTQKGEKCSWLWLAWPDATREVALELSEGWKVIPDPECVMDYSASRDKLSQSSDELPFTLPAFVLADRPVIKRWWYQKVISVPAGSPIWLRLPRQMLNPALWVNGAEVDLSQYALRMKLMQPEVCLPADLSGRVEILVRCDCETGQYGEGCDGGTGFSGSPAILRGITPAKLEGAEYRDGVVQVRYGNRVWRIAYELMNQDGGKK